MRNSKTSLTNRLPLVFTFGLAIPAFTVYAAQPSGLDKEGQMVAVAQAPTKAFSFTRLQSGIQIRVDGQTKNIIFYGPETVRVNTNLGRSYTQQPSLTVVKQPLRLPLDVKETATSLTIASKSLRIVADKQSGALTFLRPDGTLITRERSNKPAEVKEVTISDAPTYEVKQTFSLAPDESLYGLGQYDKRYMDYRGQEVLMVQTNIGIVVPLLVSTRRYGIMWDAYSKSIFKDDANGASIWAESSPAGIDYYFIGGNSMDGVIQNYRQLTGPAPMFPKSAFGLWMSKERYPTQQRLLEVVRQFRKDQFPIDNIVQDWQYWGGVDGTWSGMTWDKERFPDPRALTNELHNKLHVKLMNSIWPSVGNKTELAKELDSKGLRFAPLHWISRDARIYDAYSPEGRAIYFKYIKKGLLDVGVDALWMDGTEVEVGGACHNVGEVERDIKGLGKNAMGDFTRYLNPYTLMTTKGTYEGQRATSNKRVFTLTRSAWTGQQRYGALSWSGDTWSSWETLRNQISGGVNVAMAGQPYWTQDTGGFGVGFSGGEYNAEFRELYARWNQFGIFNPIYRIHGSSVEREPYIFKTIDPKTYDSLLGAANLRYRLMPYIYGLAWQSTDNGYTMMRGLPMDFPDDQKARKLDDQFMFGPAFLVNPITRPMFITPTPPPVTIPAQVLTTPDGKPGVNVQYFQGTNFEKPAGTAVDAQINYTWPGPPLTEIPAGLDSLENFSARWTGFITMPEDGEYEIGAEGDDGVRLWLDNQMVVDDWGEHGMRWQSKKLSFRKGQKVALKIDFYQGQGGRGLRLAWWTPSQLAMGANRPVVDSSQQTYLPSGANWYDFWTNQKHSGGATVRKDIPLDRFPLYVRAGSIVPMGPFEQYVTEKPDAPYEIRIYPGANARFVIYEDDNETYNYEKGQRATTELIWNDKSQTLTLGARQGTFPGLLTNRRFNISVASPGKNQGMGEGDSAVKTVSYSGKKMVVTF